MEMIAENFSIYIIPPLLSLITGWILAVISVVKGRFRQENILFSLVCIWWSLMPVIYVSHHLFRGNISLILGIERCIHFFYVYMPFITLLYLCKSFGFNKKFLLIFSLVQSIIISAFVPTEYYISGLYTYSWGYTAIGGVVFKIFGTASMLYLLYVIYFFIKEIRRVRGVSERLKLRYILSSFIATGILMALNLPSISGIDFYAFGNFMFIPLLLIAYGVLRYRLMDIRSVIHITMIWAVISSLIIIPNIYVYRFIKPYLLQSGDTVFFSMLVIWFFANYFYFIKIKPFIDRLFNRQKFNLMKSEASFIENVSLLRSVDELTDLFAGTMRRDLCFRSAELFLRSDDGYVLLNTEGHELNIDPVLSEWFLVSEPIIDRDLVSAIPDYSGINEKLDMLFNYMNCFFILPFVYNNELNGIAFVSERMNARTLSDDEIRYIHSIRNAISISISNSVMYQNLSDLKDRLEDKVIARTEDMLIALQKVEDINRELVEKNSELSEARRITEMDMMMAVNVQKSIFPQIPVSDREWDVAAYIRPMSGVSGDLYDFYTQGDLLKGAMLLDVSGHGVASGLITMIARSVFYRNFFAGNELTLGGIMDTANIELVREISNSEKYLTAILLRLDRESVEYVNAGHPDIIMKKGKGGTSIIKSLSDDSKGTILGVDGIQHPFRTVKFEVERGDVLLAFSDGILEASNSSGERFGFDKLIQALNGCNEDTASIILDRILDALSSFTGDVKVNDDMTVIVLVKR